MKCECGKEFEVADARQKFCSKKCRNLAGVRKHRSAVAKVEEARAEYKETGGVAFEPEIKPQEGKLPPELRNTVDDPNPDWHPGKVITESNRKMTCPLCHKLSLTHRSMCSPRNGEKFSVYASY